MYPTVVHKHSMTKQDNKVCVSFNIATITNIHYDNFNDIYPQIRQMLDDKVWQGWEYLRGEGEFTFSLGVSGSGLEPLKDKQPVRCDVY